jgi:hypothetical protein
MIKQLNALKQDVNKNKGYKKGMRLFEGAGLIITGNVDHEKMENAIVVKTNQAFELSNLIFKVKEIFKDKLDYFNKYEFYERLGKVANQYLNNNSDDNYLLLIAIIDEAIKMEKELDKLYYFAYGSNMNEEQMSKRCKNAKLIGVGKLDNYKFDLDLKGVATVLQSDKDIVWGLIWEINSDDKESFLDALVDSFVGIWEEELGL